MELILLTDYRGALRQKKQEFESLDVKKIIQYLAVDGIQAREVKLESIANGTVELSNSFVHYTSSQNLGYRPFIDDILFSLRDANNLIPRYEIFRCHENKGFQELEKKRIGLKGLGYFYFGNIRGMDAFQNQLQFPLVLKPVGGFMSSGVAMANDHNHLTGILKKMNRPTGFLKYRFKEFLKKNLLKNRYFPEMYEDCIYSGPYVLQQFSPKAKEDWKIVIFGDRYYVIRRAVRSQDFRASGSGNYAFDQPSDNVLNYARQVFNQLDVPMISIDIIEDGDTCHLIEFQGLHFGTTTQQDSPHRYELGPDGWQKILQKGNLEEDYSRALAQYLTKMNRPETS